MAQGRFNNAIALNSSRFTSRIAAPLSGVIVQPSRRRCFFCNGVATYRRHRDFAVDEGERKRDRRQGSPSEHQEAFVSSAAPRPRPLRSSRS